MWEIGWSLKKNSKHAIHSQMREWKKVGIVPVEREFSWKFVHFKENSI